MYYYYNIIKLGCDKLYVYISLNDKDNYHGIALSSILGKVLDWVILISCGVALQSSDAQFGFKPNHSTSQCIFVAEEKIQHCVKGGSYV